MKVPSETSQTLLCKQYLHKGDGHSVCDHCGQNHESLDELFDRISFGVKEYREILSNFDFLPNSPTIFNAGGKGTLSACFKFDVQDTMESILDVGRKAALVQKWGGGVGYCLSELRQKGAPIRSTHGKACGPIAVMRLYHSITEMITQGGKREGAQMAIIHCEHPDIEEFIRCKEVEGSFDTFNISVAVTDKFMQAVGSGEDIVLRDPRNGGNAGEVNARVLFNKMVEHAWAKGDPGLYFIDTAEKANPTPHLGKLTGTNPCGEVPLLNNESCNLGAINLSHFVTPDPKHAGYGILEFWRLEEVARLSVRYLDRVIEENFYPVPEIKEATLKTRKLGLGVMGWADALALLRIPYDSQEAVDLAGAVMEHIRYAAHDESRKLAKELESYGKDDMRNACVTCVAPTGSTSIIANCSSGIEPHYSLEYTQIMGDGTRLKRKLDFGDFVPKVANEIGYEWHLKHQAAFQKHTDLAVSKTINMPNSATVEDVCGAYVMAWELGCKGITVYREGSRIKQALEARTLDITEKAFPKSDYGALVHKFKIGDLKVWLHWGLKEDGTAGEVFITASKQGSTVDGLLDAVAILTSIALQSGVPLEELVDKMRGRRFEPAGLTNNPEIPTASSILDYIARYAQAKFLGTHSDYNSGMVCPACGASVISQSGCLVCAENCGWNRC